jgi:hypothetical protein
MLSNCKLQVLFEVVAETPTAFGEGCKSLSLGVQVLAVALGVVAEYPAGSTGDQQLALLQQVLVWNMFWKHSEWMYCTRVQSRLCFQRQAPASSCTA